MFYVYVLESQKDLSHYTGMSGAPRERLMDHNRGKVKATKTKRPWVIIHTESFTNRIEARKREKYLKSAAGRKFRKQLKGD